jgi:molybdate transport system permease protein
VKAPRPGTPPAIWALAAVGLAFVALPVVGLVIRVPWRDAGAILRGPFAGPAFLLSVEVATLAALLALILGLPMAWVLARGTFRGLALVRGIVVLPVVLPPVVAGVGLLTALGRRGILGGTLALAGVTLPFSTAGAVVAAAFVAMPFLVLSLEAGFRSIDGRLEDAASALGASRWYVLRRVTLPLARSSLVAGLLLAWARALGEFGATITFAGNLRGVTQTLPLAVYETLQTDPAGAVFLSLVLVGLSLVALVFLRARLLAP